MKKRCCLLVLLAQFTIWADQDVASFVAAFENGRLGAAQPVAGVKIEIGNIAFSLKSGLAAGVETVPGIQGVFFEGEGEFSYRSVDPKEHAVLKYNANKGTKLALEENAKICRISAPIERIMIFTANIAIPKIDGTDLGSLKSSFGSHRETFDRGRVPPFTHYFGLQRFNALKEKIAYAEITTGKDHLIYVLDPVEAKSESLIALQKRPIAQLTSDLRDCLWPAVISDQPIGRRRQDFLNPPFLLTHLDFTLVASKNDEADLSIVETVMPMDRPIRVFRFNLLNQKYDRYAAAHAIRVESVKNADGLELPFHHAQDQLVVDALAPMPANQSQKLHFKIAGKFLIRPGNDNFWQLGVEPWFPQPEMNGQYYTVHSVVKVEKPFIAFAPGKTVFRGEKGDFNVVENRIDKPVQFTVVHGGKYHFDEQTENGVTVRVAAYGIKKKRSVAQLGRLAHKIIAFYEPWLGPFPFKEFNILEINSVGYGQAPPGTMFITREVFQPRSDLTTMIFSQGANHRFAHEIAHQYWGHVFKMGTPEEQWLTESFAEYSSAMFIKVLKGQTGYESMVADWKRKARDAHDVAPIPLCNRIRSKDRYQDRLNRIHLVYDKGAYVLYRLHQELGDDMFLSFLRSIQGVYAWKFGTTKDVLALLNHMTKKDYTAFFDRYYWGTEMPE